MLSESVEGLEEALGARLSRREFQELDVLRRHRAYEWWLREGRAMGVPWSE